MRIRAETTAKALAYVGFGAVGPLAIASPNALWTAAVAIAIARCASLAGGGWAAACSSVVGDLARLRWLWLLAIFGLASAAWAVVPAHSLERGLRLFLEFGVGALIIGIGATNTPANARLCVLAAAGGLAIAGLFAAADILMDGSLLYWAHHQNTVLNAYGRAAAFAAIAIFPVSVLLWQYNLRMLMIIVQVIIMSFIVLAGNDTAKIVFVAAIFGIMSSVSRWTRPLSVLAFVVALVAFPLVLPQPINGPIGCMLADQKLSLVHRLGIWNFVDASIGERPLFGWGLEASRAIPGGTTYLAMPQCDQSGVLSEARPYIHERLPLHPHNFALNLWLELGATGVFLSICTLLMWAKGLFRARTQQACALTALAAGAFLPASLSFGTWQGWWISTLFVMTALCLMASRLAPRTHDLSLAVPARETESICAQSTGRIP